MSLHANQKAAVKMKSPAGKQNAVESPHTSRGSNPPSSPRGGVSQSVAARRMFRICTVIVLPALIFWFLLVTFSPQFDQATMQQIRSKTKIGEIDTATALNDDEFNENIEDDDLHGDLWKEGGYTTTSDWNNKISLTTKGNKKSLPAKDWWRPIVTELSLGVPTTTYSPSTDLNDHGWCTLQKDEIAPKDRTPEEKKQHALDMTTASGMSFVKIPKTGSSTAAAVSLQIADNIANRKFSSTGKLCTNHVHHKNKFFNRESPYFLWTVVRNPIRRSLSDYFFFHVSREGKPITAKSLKETLQKKPNLQFYWIMLHMFYPDVSEMKQKAKRNPALLQNITVQEYHLYAKIDGNPDLSRSDFLKQQLERIQKTFHFIAVTERMEESLMVMKLLYNFNDEDVITLSSKRAGGYDDGTYQRRCVKIQSSSSVSIPDRFPNVDSHMKEDFPRYNDFDYALYELANNILDQRIEELGGQEVIQEHLKKYHAMLKFAEDRCLHKTVFPCTIDGIAPNPESKNYCYWNDVGCGHSCVQEALKEYKALERTE